MKFHQTDEWNPVLKGYRLVGKYPPIKALWKPSPNFSKRRSVISAVVVHWTASPTTQSAVSWMQQEEANASYHYIVGKRGGIVQLVEEDKKAWHAGKSCLLGRTGVNDFSIGLGLVNEGIEPYPTVQIDVSRKLIQNLIIRHSGINRETVVGHDAVAIPEGRKIDPGSYFPWTELLRNLFGRDVGRGE